MRKVNSEKYYRSNLYNNMNRILISKVVLSAIVFDILKRFNNTSHCVKSIRKITCQICELKVIFYITYSYSQNIDLNFIKKIEKNICNMVYKLMNITVANVYFII